MVVDDEPHVREVLSAYLKIDGHQVTLVVDAMEALARLADTEIDIVITDSSMPGMSGEVLAKKIKESYPKMPVILLTGYGCIAEGEDGIGIDVVAVKPITRQDLRTALANAATRR